MSDALILQSLSLRMRGAPRRDFAVQMEDMYIKRAESDKTLAGRCEFCGCIWKSFAEREIALFPA